MTPLPSFVAAEVYHGGVAQMVERMLSMHEAQGSIPCSSTFFLPTRLAPAVFLPVDATLDSPGSDKPASTDRKLQRVETPRNETAAPCKKDRCLDRGSNTGPLDLQSNALPTELSKQLYSETAGARHQ
jgi:hypothetical protein